MPNHDNISNGTKLVNRDKDMEPVKLTSTTGFEKEYDSNLIKVVHISPSCVLHILSYEDTPWVLSSEISALFWEPDILRQMLHQKGHGKIKSSYLLLHEHRDIFDALDKYQIRGTVDGKVRNILSVYELTSVWEICSYFDPIHKNTKAVILKEIKLWSQP